MESDEDFFRPKPTRQQQLRAPIMSTTDTEPEMKEFNLGPIGGDKKGKKYQKAFYSTSETEEEYQAYLKSKPKWHGKGGHKDSWDPLTIASPPQIVQRPVGVVQKPVPQANKPVERGAETYSAAYVGNLTDQQLQEAYLRERQEYQQSMRSLSSDNKNQERIKKSDSIIELRQAPNGGLNAAPGTADRIQKSASIIEVIPASTMAISPGQAVLPEHSMYSQLNPNSLAPPTASLMPPAASSSSNMLQVVSSPPDSEDQTTPQGWKLLCCSHGQKLSQ